MNSAMEDSPEFGDHSDDDDDYESWSEEGVEGRRNKLDSRKSAVIYLLDSGEKMFSEDCLIEDVIPFKQCLKGIKNSMRARIWTNENTMCSVILVGTKKTDNEINLKNISVIQPLQNLSAEHILKVDEIAKKVEDFSYKIEYGCDTYSLGDALWLSSKLFTDSGKYVKLNKSIILFTNNDDPAKDDRNEFERILSRIHDMCVNDITFDLINIGENFNVNKIYKELIQMTRSDMDHVIPDPVTKMKEMIRYSNKKDYKHITLAKIPFHVTDDFECEVSIHYLVRKVKPPFQIKLSKATNERVTTKVQKFETETGQVVANSDLIRSYDVGGREVLLTAEELKHIDKFAEKGLRLIGFKPASSVSLEHYVKPCAFIYPNDPQDADESAFFVALLFRCLERQVVPICTFSPRSTSTLRYAALIAKQEELTSDNGQLSPAGFLVFFLPFAEELRDLDEKCTGKFRASREQVEAAKKLIKKLKFRYKPELFPNPKLASHWSAVEALALNLKEPESFSDATLPNYDMMRQRSGEVAEELKNIIYGDDYDPELEILRKRSKPSKPKRATADEGPGIDVGFVQEIMRSGEVQQLSNETLRMYLQQVGEGKGLSKAKKSDLIERVCKHMGIPLP